jgi:hypothetical protein
MKSYGRSTISEFLGDQIVFRNLLPCESRIPGIPDLRKKLDFPEDFLPRKSMPEYGEVIAEMVLAAHQYSSPGTSLHRVIYIGDTRMNDGQAFLNICKASGWDGIAFIGADKPGPVKVELEQVNSETLYIATRWKALEQFETYLSEKDFAINEQTAVLFDLDKTILGARGRNDKTIDAKRLEAADSTLFDVLGSEYNPSVFQDAYKVFNRVEFHPFTADNQDYLVYICMIVSSGLISQSDLVQEVRNKNDLEFMDFLNYVDERSGILPAKVCEIHHNVFDCVQSGDPTPFKAFRYNEYKCTIQHMGYLPDNTAVERILAEEIVITEEIRHFAARWKDQGALLFGLSDKPDEAVLPSANLKAQGYLPIHQTVTHVIGEE